MRVSQVHESGHLRQKTQKTEPLIVDYEEERQSRCDWPGPEKA
jgi:hypothetical protein